MKIGILTFHCAHNYGAVLQCYALQEMLKYMGYNAHVIGYEPDWMHNEYKWFNYKRFIRKNFLKSLIEARLLYTRYRRCSTFNAIQKELLVDDNIEYDHLRNDYDAIIIGSDQVWNRSHTKVFDNYYFGCFKNNNNPTIIAYAPSMENLELDEQGKNHLLDLLLNFDFLSAREQKLRDFLEGLTNRNVPLVIDPTFLLSKSVWSDFASERLIKQPYLFLYQAGFQKKAYLYAKKTAEKFGLKLVSLSSSLTEYDTLSISDVGPKGFISLVKYADFVVTTSFHGTAFSLILNKPFLLLALNNLVNTRASSILNILRIDNCSVTLNDRPFIPYFDWENINNNINYQVDISTAYLKMALQDNLS